ncbi:Protein CysO [Candidatus Lokiarchaeum ossiferum]|uniref:Protein CysO n=1 Tax=Candidatus Lokiarchaeum ossiferum TaxID=2951803 RepID=A0ABY6HT85_9ARCH|nr:Protein CysO [Candidatus Lokiarchaeum sp. B-35]
MTRYNSILDTIGSTPLVKLNKIAENVEAEIYVKVETFNPGSSVKDRIALNMIENAEKEGILNDHSKIIEPTSGNTGIGLAIVCAVKGYQLTLTMPESLSEERKKILRGLGAKLILTPAAEGMKGSIKKAMEVAEKSDNIFIPQQFKNQANPEAHRKTTALEIWEDMKHEIDVFVAGVGTGGTITGNGEVLKQLNPLLRVIAVEPIDSAILSGKTAGPHKIQGIGAGFVPEILNTNIYDEIIQITTNEAFSTARDLAKKEGIFVGISAGAATAAALKYAISSHKMEKIVVILPDTGERYLSTDLWDI